MTKKDWLIVCIILFAAFFLRVYLLTNQSLWYDEGFSIYYSNNNPLNTSSFVNTTANDRYQPLYYMLLYFWRQALGDSEFILRFFSVLWGFLTVIVLFFTVLKIYGKNNAIAAIIILSLSSYAVYYSQEVRAYSLSILLNSIQLYFFSKALLEENECRLKDIWKLMFCISCVLSFLGNILSILFTFALCLSHLLIYRNIKNWLKWWMPVLIASLPVIIFYIKIHSLAESSVNRYRSLLQNIIFMVYGLLTGTTYGPSMESLRVTDKIPVLLNYLPHLLLLFITLIMIFSAIVINIRKSSSKNRFFVCLFLLSTLFAICFGVMTKINLLPRHFFFGLLPLVIVITYVFMEAKPPVRFKKIFYGQIAVVILVILNLFSLYNYYFDKSYYRDDYRSVAEYLKDNENIPSVLLWGNVDLFNYYGYNIIDGRYLIRDILDKEIFRLSDGSEKVILVVNREFYWEKPGSAINFMSGSYSFIKKDMFPYFSLYEFRLRE